jgi:hypothetical protein
MAMTKPNTYNQFLLIYNIDSINNLRVIQTWHLQIPTFLSLSLKNLLFCVPILLSKLVNQHCKTICVWVQNTMWILKPAPIFTVHFSLILILHSYRMKWVKKNIKIYVTSIFNRNTSIFMFWLEFSQFPFELKFVFNINTFKFCWIGQYSNVW